MLLGLFLVSFRRLRLDRQLGPQCRWFLEAASVSSLTVQTLGSSVKDHDHSLRDDKHLYHGIPNLALMSLILMKEYKMCCIADYLSA